MGLFSKKQLLKVIEWNDNTTNTMVYRYPLTDRDEIMNSSTLVVRPSQVALFIHKGQIADVFAPGTYKLSTENIPIITKLLSLPTGFDSRIKAEIYYVNTKQITGIKWGTSNPIMMRDNDFGNVRVRAFGVFSYKVENPKTFMEEMFGTNAVYTSEDVNNQMKPVVIQSFADAVAESQISALDLAANYREFSSTIIEAAQGDFEKFGLKLCTMVVENISLPEEVEKALDERTKLGVLSDKMGTYTQYQAANAMRDAANNPNGSNFAAMGVGLGAGATIGGTLGQALASAKDTPKEEVKTGTKKCVKCGADIPIKAKFCPECGESQPTNKFCSNCGAKVASDAKFCPECGNKL